MNWPEPIGGGFTTYRPLGKLPSEVDWSKKKAAAVTQRAAPPEEKTCPTCGTVMYRRDFSRSMWAKRVHCSRACVKHTPTPRLSTRTMPWEMPPKQPPVEKAPHIPVTKTCTQCGEVFERPRHGQTIASWANRACCSKSCAATARARSRRKGGTWVTTPCLVCGNDVRAPRSANRKFCGLPCQHRWSRGRPRGSKAS